MHSAVALSTTWIWASSPRPASLAATVKVLPETDADVAAGMKCGLPAQAGGVATRNAKNDAATAISIRRMSPPGLMSRRVSKSESDSFLLATSLAPCENRCT
jgi:hypothetical protein